MQVGIGWDALGHTKGKIEPSQRLSPRIQAGWEGGKAIKSNQTGPANGPGEGTVFLVVGMSPCDSLPFRVEQGMPLVHVPKKSVLSQQLVKSFDFLFLLQTQTNT